jgi:hypothetical protein
VLYGIKPERNNNTKNCIHGYPMVAEAHLRSKEMRDVLVTALDEAVRLGGNQAACFDPHHAIKATNNLD